MTLQQIRDLSQAALDETTKTHQAILDKLSQLGNLTPEQQTIVDSVGTQLQTIIDTNKDSQDKIISGTPTQ